MKSKQHAMDMRSGPIVPQLIRFAVPVMLASALQLLFNTADVVVVGRFVGDTAQAAVTSNTALINLIICLFLGLSAGSGVVAGQAIGSGNEERISKAVHTSVVVGAAGGVIMGVVGFFIAPLLLQLMQVPASVFDLSALYLRVYFIGMPADLLYNFASGLLRANGDTKRPMYFLVAAGLINVILNLFFVIVLRWDVAGVAAATAIAKYISAALAVRALQHESGGMHLDLHRLQIEPEVLREIVRVGLPAGVQSATFSLSNATVQTAVNSLGEFVMAGGGISTTIGNFVHTGANATFVTCVAYTSQNFGAGKTDRIKKGVLWAAFLGGGFVLLGGELACLFGPELVSLFTNDPRVAAEALHRMNIVLRSYFLLAIMDAFSGVLRGMGWTFAPMIISLTGACGTRLIWVATVFRIFGTPRSLYLVYPASWIITGTVFAACYFVIRGKLFAKAEQQAAQVQKE